MNDSSPHRVARLTILALATSCAFPQLAAQDRLPERDVIEVPALGEGLCVHNLFQSNMVLQRDVPIRIWGWADPGAEVVVGFLDERRSTTAAADRTWQVVLAARPANSSPAVLTVTSAATTLTLDNLLIGDVWLLGGQSNMEFPLDRVENGQLEIVSARFDALRVLTVPAQNGPDPKLGFPRLHEWSDWDGHHNRKGDWDVCTPQIARELSAIGYVFARRIHMATKVPIGVIDASRGGTTVETWTPIAALRAIDTPEVRDLVAEWDAKVAAWDAQADLAQRVADFERRVAQRKEKGEAIPADWTRPADLLPGPAFDQNRPGNCHASMIAPLAGFAIKGAIFHQGYNNALGDITSGAMYRQVLTQMIRSWREAFGDPQLPFCIIDLCTDGAPQTRENYCEMMLNAGMLIREAQYQTFLDLRDAGDRRIGFASSYDQRRSWYHPQLKLPVGERASRWALATLYGFERELHWQPPRLTAMGVEDDRIVLRFDHDVSAPDDKAAIEGFAIAGEDRHFHPAEARWLVTGRDERDQPKVDRSALTLTSGMVKHPIHFRYAWGRNPMGNLQIAGHSDLPLATQRSDAWPVEDVPLGVLEGEAAQGGRLTRKQRGAILEALRRDDLSRRLTEARALIEEHGEPVPPRRR